MVVRVGGELTYELKLEPLVPTNSPKTIASHDDAGRARPPAGVYVEGQPARASYLTNALEAQQFDVAVRTAAAFPASLRESRAL